MALDGGMGQAEAITAGGMRFAFPPCGLRTAGGKNFVFQGGRFALAVGTGLPGAWPVL